jgi:hypothetical protein
MSVISSLRFMGDFPIRNNVDYSIVGLEDLSTNKTIYLSLLPSSKAKELSSIKFNNYKIVCQPFREWVDPSIQHSLNPDDQTVPQLWMNYKLLQMELEHSIVEHYTKLHEEFEKNPSINEDWPIDCKEYFSQIINSYETNDTMVTTQDENDLAYNNDHNHPHQYTDNNSTVQVDTEKNHTNDYSESQHVLEVSQSCDDPDVVEAVELVVEAVELAVEGVVDTVQEVVVLVDAVQEIQNVREVDAVVELVEDFQEVVGLVEKVREVEIVQIVDKDVELVDKAEAVVVVQLEEVVQQPQKNDVHVEDHEEDLPNHEDHEVNQKSSLGSPKRSKSSSSFNRKKKTSS